MESFIPPKVAINTCPSTLRTAALFMAFVQRTFTSPTFGVVLVLVADIPVAANTTGEVMTLLAGPDCA